MQFKIACKVGVFCGVKIDINVLPPSWTLKLTESSGESKNDSKGEVDGSNLRGKNVNIQNKALTAPALS